jgi:hypothetical protein
VKRPSWRFRCTKVFYHDSQPSTPSFPQLCHSLSSFSACCCSFPPPPSASPFRLSYTTLAVPRCSTASFNNCCTLLLLPRQMLRNTHVDVSLVVVPRGRLAGAIAACTSGAAAAQVACPISGMVQTDIPTPAVQERVRGTFTTLCSALCICVSPLYLCLPFPPFPSSSTFLRYDTLQGTLRVLVKGSA